MESLSGCRSPPIELNHSLHSGLSKGEREKDDEVEPVIIGGMVLDIHATPFVAANPRTTTPGKVCYTLGGVARNVAECMSKLRTKPYMISALGLDMAGNLLLEHWKSSGLSIEGIRRCKNIKTAIVCNIFDVKGEVAAGVASVESIEKFLTPEWIRQFECNICSAPVLMIDANLSPPALEASCQVAAEYGTPVWFEPVSVAKSKRVASIVKYITFASPNEGELIAMANSLSGEESFSPIQIDNSRTKYSTESLFQMLKPAMWFLLEKGVKVIVVTLGSHGVFVCSKGGADFKKIGLKRKKPHGFSRQLYETVHSICPADRFLISSKNGKSSCPFAVHFPALLASVVRLTGAGDCLVGGALASICAGLDVLRSVAVGIAAAKGAVEAETNVPSEYSLAKIAEDARSVYFDAKVVFCQSML
ncbi:hypothetical protein LguiB_022213 [Lonicera macranthoides]